MAEKYKGAHSLSQSRRKNNRSNKTYLWILIVLIAFISIWFITITKNNQQNPNTILEAYIADEAKENFAHMYDYLSTETRDQLLRDEFVEKYETAYHFFNSDQTTITFDPLDKQSLEFAEKDGNVIIPTNFTYELSKNKTFSIDYETPLIVDLDNNKQQWSINYNEDLLDTPIALPHMLEQLLNSVHKPLQEEKIPTAEERINLLFIVQDDRTGGNGPQSKFNLITFDQQDMSMKMTMIPRDMRTYLPEIDQEYKIFHTLAYGGVDAAVEAVEEMFDFPIHYYLTFNLSGLKSFFDFTDGITVDNNESFTADGLEFPEGTIKLDQDEMLTFIGYDRFLKNDISFAQFTKRHQNVLHGFWETFEQHDLDDMITIFELFQKYITTNIDIDLFKKLLLASDHLDYV